MSTLATEGLFSDDVFTATDLNRRGGAILDRARRGPVTISRNNEQFALLRREEAAHLVATVRRLVRVLGLIAEAHTAIAGGRPSAPFQWLEAFDRDDLEKLVAEVLGEARRAASGGSDWDSVEALIHAWRESAAVAASGVLDPAMFETPGEELPLEHPEDVRASTEETGPES